MNEFVEECLREWKQRGVSDPVAKEMAAELAADLEEADAEGASAEDVLGTGSFDARAFATAWATERGLIQQRPPGHGFARGSRIAAAVGVFALTAAVGAVLVIVASPSTPKRLTLAAPLAPPLMGVRTGNRPPPLPPVDARVVVFEDGQIVASVPPAPSARILRLDIDDSVIDTRNIGWVLMTVGLAGVVAPLTMLWLRAGPGTRIEDRPSSPAY